MTTNKFFNKHIFRRPTCSIRIAFEQANKTCLTGGSSFRSTTTSASTAHHHSTSGIGPAVRSLLQIYKLNSTSIQATGPGGRLLKGDVLQYVKLKGLLPAPLLQTSPQAIPAQPVAPVSKPLQSPVTSLSKPIATHVDSSSSIKIKDTLLAKDVVEKKFPFTDKKPNVLETGDIEFEDLPLSNMRKVIARRLTESKTTIPHSYASAQCDLQNLLSLRKQLQSDGIKVSVNDFIIKAAAVALQRVPSANAVWTGNGARQQSSIDISIAVATDSGLITPIVRDAVALGLQGIADTVKDLSTRARSGKLQLQEFQGGSFTISNLGMFGISEFSAVINPPQACILAVGGSRLVLGDDGKSRTLMTVTLSADGRIVDDALAATFLNEFKAAIEQPRNSLLG